MMSDAHCALSDDGSYSCGHTRSGSVAGGDQRELVGCTPARRSENSGLHDLPADSCKGTFDIRCVMSGEPGEPGEPNAKRDIYTWLVLRVLLPLRVGSQAVIKGRCIEESIKTRCRLEVTDIL